MTILPKIPSTTPNSFTTARSPTGANPTATRRSTRWNRSRRTKRWPGLPNCSPRRRRRILGESSYPETFEIAGRLGNLPVYASISKRGGMVINLFVNKTVAKIDLTEKDAEILAVEYAEHLGYKSLRPVWYNENAGIAYVNLAPEADGIVYYTDLVKVKIAMDDGTVMGLEATGYCLNHTDRTLSPVIDAETAESLVSDKLTVTSTRLCVIPDGENEAFCYEVAGTYKGLDYFVYVDAVRGEQVNILRVIDEGQGRLTI